LKGELSVFHTFIQKRERGKYHGRGFGRKKRSEGGGQIAPADLILVSFSSPSETPLKKNERVVWKNEN